MKITLDIPDRNIENAITAGMDSGIRYWCRAAYFECFRGMDCWRFEERDTDITHTVYRDDLERALARMVHLASTRVPGETHGPGWAKRVGNLLCDRTDCEDGDLLIQLACFGEVKYG